jgi:hypothetical protein
MKEERWRNGKIRNVQRNSKGQFVKWSPQMYKYEFKVYTCEDTQEGTSVNLEAYTDEYISDETTGEIERKYTNRVGDKLVSTVGKKGKHFVFRGGKKVKGFNFIQVSHEKTSLPKSKGISFDSMVLNIGSRIGAKHRHIKVKQETLKV